jgi:hypothetical protein
VSTFITELKLFCRNLSIETSNYDLISDNLKNNIKLALGIDQHVEQCENPIHEYLKQTESIQIPF